MSLAADRGHLHRNFQGYTTDPAETLLGLGASSIGKTPAGFVQNFTETGAWSRAVEAGEPPVARGYAFQQDDAVRAAVIEQLMCRQTVNLDAIGKKHGAPENWYADALPRLAEYDCDGLISMKAGSVCLTSVGQTYARVVASAFDRYFAPSEARHAVAV